MSGRSHGGHHRTPDYVKDRTGTIVVRHGAFRNPETRAYGEDGLPKQELYLVALEDESRDRIFVDVYEHWLEADE